MQVASWYSECSWQTGKEASIPLKSLQSVSVNQDSEFQWRGRKMKTLIDKPSPAVKSFSEAQEEEHAKASANSPCALSLSAPIRDERGRSSQRSWSVEIFPAARACLRGFGLAYGSEESLHFQGNWPFFSLRRVNSLSAKEINTAQTPV